MCTMNQQTSLTMKSKSAKDLSMVWQPLLQKLMNCTRFCDKTKVLSGVAVKARYKDTK